MEPAAAAASAAAEAPTSPPLGSSLSDGLLPGEAVLAQFRSRRTDSRGRPACAAGTLVVTKFRLRWTPPENSSAAAHDVPIACVGRVRWLRGGSLKITCKDLSYVKLFFSDVESSLKIMRMIEAAAFPGSIERLFAFEYRPQFAQDGWAVYDPVAEFARIGVPDAHWRVSEANKGYAVCDSYPQALAVPAGFTDRQIFEAAKFRTSGRLPVLCWRHPETRAAILRSSQPRVGLRDKSCESDIQLMAAVRAANEVHPDQPIVIIDARPIVNAIVNKATKGAGAEKVSHYEKATLQFMNIENIHVMRDSQRKLRKLIAHIRSSTAPADRMHKLKQIDSGQWMLHIQQLLSASVKVATTVMEGSSVLVHCSDGWDRTPQLVSLALLMLDPFYRTIRGFEVLVEKQWISHGHKFSKRVSHGSKKDSDYSPIFVQFLDCLWQLLLQFPYSFEFSDNLLATLEREMHACRFGTFLADTEKMRTDLMLAHRTPSLWSMVNSQLQTFRNPNFDPAPGSNGGVIIPKTNTMFFRLWSHYFNDSSDLFASVDL
eukprot:m51a1_g5706 putative myotubularin-related protein 2 (543) ;mRNA; f:1066659-1068999